MNNYKLGKNSFIKANKINIDDSVIIGDNVEIVCDEISIGFNSYVGDNIKINCKKFEAGDWLYMCERVEVGRGGCTGPNSNVKIGNHVGIFEGTVINPSESVEIGDDVGIGGEVMIWTHGAWLDVTQGFPSDFGPVKIGNNVWLPARSIVLPNVTIGDNSVIGIGSTINKNLPSGCLAAGSPCKVIRENCYPKELTEDELEKIILNIIDDWFKLHKDKNIKDVQVDYDTHRKIITLKKGKNEIHFTHYHIDTKEMIGITSDVSEDLRDYLRRRGIKIYTNKPFKSIKPEWI
jgi:acetyltransferase-like isoleucine patch superfamily enzyme